MNKKPKYVVIRNESIICEGDNYASVYALAESNNSILAKRYHGKIIKIKSFEKAVI